MKKLSTAFTFPAVIALLACVIGLIFLNAGPRDAEGIRLFPLDDTYIHMQYGWQAAQGDFLTYNPGDAPTSGATSLLYMVILAVGFSLNISRAAMPDVLAIINIGSFALGAALITDVTRTAAASLNHPQKKHPLPTAYTQIAGITAGFIFATSGWMVWAALSGMETLLLITLIIAILWSFVKGHIRLTALLTALTVLTRPETLLIAGMLVFVQILRDPAEEGSRIRRFLWSLLPFAVYLISPLVNWAYTGSPSATGFLAKSWFTVEPFYVIDAVRNTLETALSIFLRTFGAQAPDGVWHTLPLIQLLMLIGLGLMAWKGNIRNRRLALLCLGWVGAGIAATSTLQTATWHHHRYQMPLYPAFIVPAAIAIAWLVDKLAKRLKQRLPIIAAAVGILLMVWGVVNLASFHDLYTLDTETVHNQQMVLADWLRENTPQDATITVHDVGVMRYAGNRHTVDVVGLTTNGMAAINRHGPGAIYEALEGYQPDYYAVYPQAAPPYYGLEQAPLLFGKELFRVAIDPWSSYTSADAVQVITQPDWSGVTLADSSQQSHMLPRLDGLTLIDRLDIADTSSEDAHAYTWWHEGHPGGYLTLPEVLSYIDDAGLTLPDGGRILTGGASFTLNNTDPAQNMLLVARHHQTEAISLTVRVNGSEAGQWRIPAMPGQWLETAFVIPAELLDGSSTDIELVVDNPDETKRYSAFHYWAYQGDTDAPRPEPSTTSNARFGDVVDLLGYDVPEEPFAPGDVLPLTLHWQAVNPNEAQHRVFVHLIDPSNDTADGIMAQADSAPMGNTHPFWAWQADETVSDTMHVFLPAEAPPGDYALVMGIYDPATGQRLTITGEDNWGHDRLYLATLTIR